ncbi:kinase-like protein [Aspergillus fijiensis CBS 313.89]|uniref:non-specific serine/threonine protein kinase n=1 Tax=Aspergillus fijiensis CBS 313.89 TaxID=1448319 RepID=A0A8G1RJE0_9EURO|nr:kinase-like protein [Aspergillus fijiensis CBS 313.89]RAK72536.1 kinase-like protein [Aspergillus fijiensis CBS 313.89]
MLLTGASISRLSPRISRHFFPRRPVFQRPASPVRACSQLCYPLLDATKKLEEETLPWYQVIGKLGYGGYSTVWLCRDLQMHDYITLKVFERNSAEGQREVETYRHLNTLGTTDHAGAKLFRKALDSFQITSEEGNFGCLVHPTLGISLYDFRAQLRAKVLPESIVKLTLIHLLLALDYLHTDAGIVHTDIQEKNIMMAIGDPSILADFEEEEKSGPSPRKSVGDRVIYASRKLRRTTQHGRSTLCDFGQARRGSDTYHGDIQPYIYRAPENAGWLTWDLFEQGHLFHGRDSDKKSSDAHHIAEIIANSVYATEFFDDEGNWKGAIEIPSRSLETLEGNLEGEPRLLFLRFLRKMLQWKPEERFSARELLEDPWLRSP